MKKKQQKNKFYGLLVLLIVCIVMMRIFDAPLKNEVCTGGIVSFELAREMTTSQAILESWDSQAKSSAYRSLFFDFLFLVVYSSFIAVLIGRIRTKFSPNTLLHRVGQLLGILIFVAALFDILENIALLRIMGGDFSQIWATVAYYAASIKFGLILLSLIYLLVGWLTSRFSTST